MASIIIVNPPSHALPPNDEEHNDEFTNDRSDDTNHATQHDEAASLESTSSRRVVPLDVDNVAPPSYVSAREARQDRMFKQTLVLLAELVDHTRVQPEPTEMEQENMTLTETNHQQIEIIQQRDDTILQQGAEIHQLAKDHAQTQQEYSEEALNHSRARDQIRECEETAQYLRDERAAALQSRDENVAKHADDLRQRDADMVLVNEKLVKARSTAASSEKRIITMGVVIGGFIILSALIYITFLYCEYSRLLQELAVVSQELSGVSHALHIERARLQGPGWRAKVARTVV